MVFLSQSLTTFAGESHEYDPIAFDDGDLEGVLPMSADVGRRTCRARAHIRIFGKLREIQIGRNRHGSITTICEGPAGKTLHFSESRHKRQRVRYTAVIIVSEALSWKAR